MFPFAFLLLAFSCAYFLPLLVLSRLPCLQPFARFSCSRACGHFSSLRAESAIFPLAQQAPKTLRLPASYASCASFPCALCVAFSLLPAPFALLSPFYRALFVRYLLLPPCALSAASSCASSAVLLVRSVRAPFSCALRSLLFALRASLRAFRDCRFAPSAPFPLRFLRFRPRELRAGLSSS